MMRGVDRFVNRRDGSVVQPGKPSGNQVQASENAFTGPSRRAHELRVPVPVTRLGGKPDGNVSSLPALAAAVAARYPLSPDAADPVTARISKFDETDFEGSTISSIGGPQRGNLMVDEGHDEQQYGDEGRDYEADADPAAEEEDQAPDGVYHHKSLSEEIAEARRLYPENARYFQVQSPSFRKFIDNATNDHGPAPPMVGSPSRPRTSHRSVMPPPPSRVVEKTAIVPAKPSAIPITTSFDKTCSFTDSGRDISPPSPGPPAIEERGKRPRPDYLDYDLATLKAMSFETLENQPFDLDPRCAPPPDIAISSSSHSSAPHHQKLSGLRSLSESERSDFFSSQSKDQWSASMTFLGKRLQELLGELDEARNRRRDVAARFEDEIADRMRGVKGNAEGIDRCLAQIRGKARGVLPSGNGNEGKILTDGV